MTQLEKCKLLLGITSTDKDDVLNLLIDDATNFIEDYCHLDEDDVPSSLISEVVCYRFNMLGNEGVSSESYSGASFSYLNDLPAGVIKHLNANRKVVFK